MEFEFPEEKIKRQLDSGEITFEEAEKQLKRIIKHMKTKNSKNTEGEQNGN